MISVTIEVTEKEWKEFLTKSESATIYHTPEWKTILEKSFGYEPYYLFAEDESGKIIGLLPLFNIKSKLTGNRLCSVPFSHVCGPIGDKTAVNLLISEGVNLYKDLNVNRLEIRGLIDFNGFQHQNAFSTYILELLNVESTWNLVHKSVRRYIKKSQNYVAISKSNNIEDADFFFQINCKNKKDKGVPAHPKKFIYNLVNTLSDNLTIYLAKLKNENVGCIITLPLAKYKVLYGYGASDPQYLNYHPLYSLLWRSIEDACMNGYKYYDFGRASYDNVGLINFKKRWGTVEKKLYYSYYPKKPESLTENRDNLKYKLGTKIIRRMPMPIYKKFSDVVFGSFG